MNTEARQLETLRKDYMAHIDEELDEVSSDDVDTIHKLEGVKLQLELAKSQGALYNIMSKFYN